MHHIEQRSTVYSGDDKGVQFAVGMIKELNNLLGI